MGGSQADPQAQAFSILSEKSSLLFLLRGRGLTAHGVVVTGLLGEGFGWANFDFGGGPDEQDEAGSKRRQAATVDDEAADDLVSITSAKPEAADSCSSVQQELADWVDTLKAKGPVSRFFQRQLTCAAVLVLLCAVRSAVRRAQMLYYPDEPPPGDMAWPGWEGPGEF